MYTRQAGYASDRVNRAVGAIYYIHDYNIIMEREFVNINFTIFIRNEILKSLKSKLNHSILKINFLKHNNIMIL